ncbi:MAG: hypothetical protein HY774_14330 [Acidobacteria bacterium]|nr:hypothetical protein [Acidobacteriota bacterium]
MSDNRLNALFTRLNFRGIQSHQTTSQAEPRVHPGLIATLVLGGLITAVFWISREYAMLEYDSTNYILADRAIRVIDWEHIQRIFQTHYFINYNPLHRISYMFDWWLWGTDPAGYRGTNILLHWIAAAFVFLFFHELVQSQSVAWMVSLVFAIHPTRVENVVWLAQRKDVLSAAFGFCALWMYRRFQEIAALPASDRSVSQKRQFMVWYLGCLLMYTGALASKAQWVPLCAVFFLVDLYERRPMTRNVWVRYLPFVALSLFFAWMAIEAQYIQGAKHGDSYSLLVSIKGVVNDCGFYILHTFWPLQLCPRYPEATVKWVYLVIGLGFLGVILASLWKQWNRKHDILFGCGWFFLFLSPMLNLVPTNLIHADRYLYVALIGLIFPLAMGLRELRPLISTAVTATVVVVLAVVTLHYVPVWKDGFSLWTHTVAHFPTERFALASLASEQIDRGEYQAAQHTLDLIVRHNKPLISYFFTLTKLYEKTNQDPRIPLEQALKQGFSDSELLSFYGKILVEKKEYARAEPILFESLRRKPDLPTLVNLTKLFVHTNRPREAEIYIISALSADVFHEEYWYWLGRVKDGDNDRKTAELAYRQSTRLAPDYIEPRLELAQHALVSQQLADAERWLTDIPGRFGKRLPAEGYTLLATIYERQGKFSLAAAALTEALQVQDSPETRARLSQIQIQKQLSSTLTPLPITR